jgi:hypothetical protein
VLHHREVVRAVILAGKNSSKLLELLDHKGIPSVLLGDNCSRRAAGFREHPDRISQESFMPFFHRKDIECLANR